MKEKIEITKEMERRIEELKQKFEGLTKSQKELLLYREIKNIGGDTRDYNDFFSEKNQSELVCLIKAADMPFLKPTIVYAMRINFVKYRELYQKSLIHYNNILQNYKVLAQELNINSALELSHLLTYMLWSGYFSVSKEHSYKLQNRLMLPGLYSFDVIKGQGVCLAYAELLNNFLSLCDVKSSMLICKVPTGKKDIICDYKPKIERKEESNIRSKILTNVLLFSLRGLIDKFGNHAITLIDDQGKIYAYDPTNLYVLNIKNFNTASLVNGSGEFKIKPLETFIANPYADSNKIFEKILLGNFNSSLSRKEFILNSEKLMELINENIHLLDDAYDNTHDDLEFINNETNEIGDYFKILKRAKEEHN